MIGRDEKRLNRKALQAHLATADLSAVSAENLSRSYGLPVNEVIVALQRAKMEAAR